MKKRRAATTHNLHQRQLPIYPPPPVGEGPGVGFARTPRCRTIRQPRNTATPPDYPPLPPRPHPRYPARSRRALLATAAPRRATPAKRLATRPRRATANPAPARRQRRDLARPLRPRLPLWHPPRRRPRPRQSHHRHLHPEPARRAAANPRHRHWRRAAARCERHPLGGAGNGTAAPAHR